MDKLQQLEQAKESFLTWLTETGADSIKDLDDSDELNFHFHIVTGFFTNKPFVACFGMSSEDHMWITFNGDGTRLKGLSIDQFNQFLSTLEAPKTEHELEVFDLNKDEQWIICFEDNKPVIKLKQKH